MFTFNPENILTSDTATPYEEPPKFVSMTFFGHTGDGPDALLKEVPVVGFVAPKYGENERPYLLFQALAKDENGAFRKDENGKNVTFEYRADNLAVKDFFYVFKYRQSSEGLRFDIDQTRRRASIALANRLFPGFQGKKTAIVPCRNKENPSLLCLRNRLFENSNP